MHYYRVEPTPENYWRGIILFGKNVASYKFALAQALYDTRRDGSDLILLEDLAVPFSEHLCRHLKDAPKQITSQRSQFLAACAQHNAGELTRDALTDITVRRGFNNVIDAFHIVNQGEIDKRFFIDERKTHKGIRLTENFFRLGERLQYQNLRYETESRWKLVEQGWALKISANLLDVQCDEQQMLYSMVNTRRVTITRCRDSLNGYQKGRCFYCDAPIMLASGDVNLADVDHFIPWSAQADIPNINGIWNLVLACKSCNRGEGGKFARLPSLRLLRRLYDRNEYFITSHLPLRETLIRQTGKTPKARSDFLNQNWNTALNRLFHQWEPDVVGPDLF